jgi:hypothetical protein
VSLTAGGRLHKGCKKLDAMADGMADLMSYFADEDNNLRNEIKDLKAAVGLEEEV